MALASFSCSLDESDTSVQGECLDWADAALMSFLIQQQEGDCGTLQHVVVFDHFVDDHALTEAQYWCDEFVCPLPNGC
jgi:hypothetical protein